MPGSLNWRTKHARKMFTRCGLAPAGWLRDGFDLGKRRRSLERQNLQTKPSGGKLTCPKHVIFMSKCLELLTGERSMPGKSLRDVALGQLAGCEMGLTLESEGEVPHLRWSQAPPLPWPRPGSADIYILYTQIYIYIYTHIWIHVFWSRLAKCRQEFRRHNCTPLAVTRVVRMCVARSTKVWMNQLVWFAHSFSITGTCCGCFNLDCCGVNVWNLEFQPTFSECN